MQNACRLIGEILHYVVVTWLHEHCGLHSTTRFTRRGVGDAIAIIADDKFTRASLHINDSLTHVPTWHSSRICVISADRCS